MATDICLRSSTHNNNSFSHRRSSNGITIMSSTGARRSFFGSVKDKISRKPSIKSITSTEANTPTIPGAMTATNNPQPTTPAASTNNNPFSNPSPATRRPRNEPPPPYSEATSASAITPTISIQGPTIARAASPAPSAASAISVASLSTPEDPYAFLSQFDTVFLIDDSGSMAGRSWREVKEALRAITPICTAHDNDGIDVYFLNARNISHTDGGYTSITSTAQVEDLFSRVRPYGGTPTGTRINQILKPYLRTYERKIAATGDPDNSGVKPVNMIVITDGVPTDDPESVIISVAKKLDKLEAPPHQVGIQFFQVGTEPGAREALMELDDGLAAVGGGVRDIVDTVTWNGRDSGSHVLSAEAILKVVLGAVVKRLDRRRASGESRRVGHLAP
ncbi:hypothetical protein B0T19DRAFT_430287 [Cercophora scortea]|uniref:VWFA domain-containing protein n=1 Tax=Cercophora scortea TaxID=314031 RepID=A0AAE0M648_9PEZI|nr:hypothetical protein B0T19DRAFT_430287 [Cercophora scortea]